VKTNWTIWIGIIVENDNSTIIDHLVMNKDHYIYILRDDIAQLNMMMFDNELRLFQSDFISQFEKNCKYSIAEDLALKFNRKLDDMYAILDDVNMKEYLK
jgi:hypothetical protein